MSDRTFQSSTIAMLRQIHADNRKQAAALSRRAQKVLASAGEHAALARDAAALLEQSDPSWTAGRDESPEGRRLLQLRNYREMLDFLDAHPEIGIGNYESISIYLPNGDRATAEYLGSLKDSGLTVESRTDRVSAELWFGNTVSLRGWANIEPPAEADPAAIEEHQADEGAAVADLEATLDSAIEVADSLVEELAQEVDEQQASPSTDESPFAVGERVVLVSAHRIGRLGNVTSIRPDEVHVWQIYVLLDGNTKSSPFGPLDLASVPDGEQPVPFVQATPAEVAQAYEVVFPADELPEYIDGDPLPLDDDIDARRAEADAEADEQPLARWERELLEHTIEKDDRVRVHPAPAPGGPRDFPAELDGAEGVVVSVEPGTFSADLERDPQGTPIEVLLDGRPDPQCFAVAEVDVIQAAADQTLIGKRS